MSELFIVIFEDERVDPVVKGYTNLDDAIGAAEKWIVEDQGYEVSDWEKCGDGEPDGGYKALLHYHHPCRSNYVAIHEFVLAK